MTSDGVTINEVMEHLQSAADRWKGVRLQPEAVSVVLRVLKRATEIQSDPEHPDHPGAQFILTGSYPTPRSLRDASDNNS